MYEYIKGTVAEVAPAYAVIDVGGVGYYLHISLETYSAIEHETETRLYVHYVVREDAQLLYGFSTKAERELFRLLISVSGVGGNTARMILSTYSPRELQGIITAGNAVLLKNVKGLGLKTAQKIIVELSGKLMAPGADDGGAQPGAGGSFDEALAALSMLGFARAPEQSAWFPCVCVQDPYGTGRYPACTPEGSSGWYPPCRSSWKPLHSSYGKVSLTHRK